MHDTSPILFDLCVMALAAVGGFIGALIGLGGGALVVPGLLVAGCSMAPAYRVPTSVAIPAQFKEAPGWAVAAPADAVARGAWWDVLRDPALDALERRVAEWAAQRA